MIVTRALLVLSFASGIAVADTVIQTGIPGGGAADLLKQTKPPAFIQSGEDTGIRLTSECTGSDGTRYAPSDAGYAICVRQTDQKHVPQVQGAGDSGSAVGVKVGK